MTCYAAFILYAVKISAWLLLCNISAKEYRKPTSSCHKWKSYNFILLLLTILSIKGSHPPQVGDISRWVPKGWTLKDLPFSSQNRADLHCSDYWNKKHLNSKALRYHCIRSDFFNLMVLCVENKYKLMKYLSIGGEVKMAYQEDVEFASPHNQGTYQALAGDHGHLTAQEEPPVTG